jgi:hypothetical protein
VISCNLNSFMKESLTLNKYRIKCVLKFSNLNHVGYLMIRFEYFQGRFAQEADQQWTEIELDELHPMDYLFFSQDPSIKWKNLKFCQKTNRTQKNLGRFAQEVDQSGPRMGLDRTRRALSDRLLIFFLAPFLHGENPDILPQP